MTGKNPLVVLSDDEPAFVELYTLLLKGEGYRIASFNDRRRLLNLLEIVRPDLIVTGISSSGMDGLEFLRCAEMSPATRDIPIIVASVRWEDMDEALVLGARDFLLKPFEVEEFIIAVKEAVIHSPWVYTEN